MQQNIGFGTWLRNLLVFSWVARHLQPPRIQVSLPIRHIPAGLEQLRILTAHTCTLLIELSRVFSWGGWYWWNKRYECQLQTWSHSCSNYLRAGRYTPELSSLKSHLPAACFLANVGPLGWLEAVEGNYFQDHLTTSACRYREYKLQGADCILKIRQLVRSHGKFGLVVLLVASILWLNAVLQFQSQLLAWFTATLEYLNVYMTSFPNISVQRRLTDR